MKNKILTLGVITLVALILVALYLYLTPSGIIPPDREEPRSLEMEKSLTEIVNQVAQENSNNELNLSVSNLTLLQSNSKLEVKIALTCKRIPFEQDQAIVESIMNKLITAYPEEFSNASTRNSEVLIAGCSQMGSSPDGVNVYYSTTSWRILRGQIDFAI